MSSNYPDLRYRKTLSFLKQHVDTSTRILDLGTPNPFSEVMIKEGYNVQNTKGEDLDTDFKIVNDYDVDCYTSFELFEHLLAPYNVLSEIKKGKLVVSVPLKVWFAKAYWNPREEWDRHYHEFEPRQFDWLLEKAGWTIKAKEQWASPDKLRFGIRPLLRYIWPGYYFVYAEKGL
jgi:predicted glycosyltransferase involved in capsule biosynthesis